MATQTFEQLIAGANKIKENELPESNTHDLIGEQLLQMTNKMREISLVEASEAAEEARRAAEEAKEMADIASQSGELAQYAKEQGDYAKSAGDKVTNEVLFKTAQSLTEEEQQQTWNNLGLDSIGMEFKVKEMSLFGVLNGVFDINIEDTLPFFILTFYFRDMDGSVNPITYSTTLTLGSTLREEENVKYVTYFDSSDVKGKILGKSYDGVIKVKFEVESTNPSLTNTGILAVTYPTSYSPKFKGWFNSVIPSGVIGENGSYAFVGNPRHIYEWQNGWQDRGEYITDIDTVLSETSGKAIANKAVAKKFSELGIKVKYDNDLVKNESNTIIYNNSNKVKGNLIVTVLQNLTDYNKLNLAIIKKDGSKFYSSIDITNKSNLFRLDKYEDLEYIDFIYVSPISEENKGHLTIEICIGQVYTADDITNKTLDGLAKKDEQLQSSIDSNKANIEKDFNSKVFTNNFDANRVIRKLFIDTTNYSGSYSLEGLYIDIIARNISSQWGVLVKNSEKQNIIAKWMQSEESIQSDVYSNGIYLYVEYNWDNMDDQSSVKGSPFLLTNEVFNKNNDPRNSIKEENIKDGSISKDKLNAILQEGFEKTAYIDGLNVKINEVLAYRDNLYENSLSPEIFPYNKEGKNNFGCTIEIDTDSPFKDLIGFKRVFLNTMTENNASCYYRQRNYNMKKSKPNSINVAFWTKESEFKSIFESHFEFWISTEMRLSINPSNAYDGIPVETKITGGTNYIKSSNGKFSILEKNGDYIRVLIEFTNIVWFEGFDDTELEWYFLFNNTENKNKPLTIIDFTILLDEKIASGVMYPDTNNLVGSPTLQSVQNLALENRKRIDVLEKNNEGDIKLKFRDNYVFIARDWSDDEYLVSRININRKASVDNNPNINFEQDYLANKQGGIDVSSKSIKDCGDDICPANIFGSYIGGNHGWNMPYKVTSSAHGKTVKDVGAIYRDSDGVEFVILRYTDENNLHIISKNQSTDGFSYSFKKPTGTLTYVSNGESQTELTVESAVEDGNFHPSTTESKKQFFVDGKLRTDENSCNIFDIIESYDVVDLISAIDKIVSNRPSNGYDENPFLPNLDGVEFLFNHTICYRFTSDGNITINTTFKPYKKLRLNFHGFVQAGALSQGNIYIPKTKEISGYDFTKYGVNWTNPPSEAINIRPDNWENTESAPDRIVNYNDDVNFMIGYITDRTKVGKGRKNYVSDRAIFLWTSRKLYPMGIDKTGDLDALANESYSLIGYRCYTNPSKLNGRTNIAKLKVGTDIFIFLDYHKSMIDTVELDYSYGGKEIQIYEKNDRCSLLDEVVIGNSFRVQSMADVDNYGYIVLKIIM